MVFLDKTFSTAKENLKMEEKLLAWREKTSGEGILRIWEPTSYFIVLGKSNKAQEEINTEAAEKDNIEVFKRDSGGGTVLLGPGCLVFSLILEYRNKIEYKTVKDANLFILNKTISKFQSTFVFLLKSHLIGSTGGI